MNEIITIEELRKQFTEKTKVKDLKLFAESQQHLIEKLMQDNSVLQEKLNYLEKVMVSTIQVATKLSDEEVICMEQISSLRDKSSNRELSLDEVKRLDLLIKNLRLIREQSTEVIDTTSYSEVKEEDLVAIARSPEQEKDR